MKSIETTSIRVSGKPGNNITDCLREAASVALETQQTVVLEFNGKDYKITASKIINSILGFDKGHNPE